MLEIIVEDTIKAVDFIEGLFNGLTPVVRFMAAWLTPAVNFVEKKESKRAPPVLGINTEDSVKTKEALH